MKNKKILITGSSGLIGSYLYKKLADTFEIVGLDVKVGATSDICLDFRDSDVFMSKLQQVNPDIVIHTGAMKSLLECENNPGVCSLVNVQSTADIVRFAEKENKMVIYLSSDVVFDGEFGNYKENDLPSPINMYGKTKYESELLVKSLKRYAICRTALVIGELDDLSKDILNEEVCSGVALNNQSLLPYYILRKLKNGERIMMPDKIISNPTHVELIRKSVVNILDKDLTGIFHCVGSESISRFEFAKKVAIFFKMDTGLISIDENKILAIRPKNLSMNCDKTYGILGFSKEDWTIASLLNRINI